METFNHLFSYSIMAFSLVLLSPKVAVHGDIIGAIVDLSSRMGKEEKVAMEIAIDDFFNYTNQRLVLQVKDSQGEPIQAALAATELVETEYAEAILGPQKWEETSLVAEICTKSKIPLLSLADSTPRWAINHWPSLIQSSPSQNAQMKAVAAIVESWGFRRVGVLYEDTYSFTHGVITRLSDALNEIGVEISHFIPLPPFSSSSLSEELEKLKREQCRVFVVHSSLELALRLFAKANEMEMMEKEYVWITTNTITNLVHSVKASSISSMQGVIGVKSSFQENGLQFQEFLPRFHKMFNLEHPEEENHEPGFFALQAYNAAWAVASSMKNDNKEDQNLLEKILLTDFDGIGGRVKFIEQKLTPSHIFQIVNVIGKSYRELGYWSEGLGFSKSIGGNAIYNASMENLGQVFWPGGPWATPGGWATPTVTNPLRVGVPNESLTGRFVNVKYDSKTDNYSVTGFSIEVFKATLNHLPYYVAYEFIPFGGNSDDLVEQIYLKNFDATVGAAMLAKRSRHAEFSQPHTESGVVMVVPVQSQLSNKALLFVKPFTKAMWILTASVNVYNGFVIWMIEKNHCSELKGSALNQIGTLLWLAFSTLFSLHGEKLHSNLSRMATVVWLFVALVIMQCYTASLTSMLTVQRLEPKVANIETLKNSNAMVGYTRKTFLLSYLEDVLGFKHNNMRNLTTMEGCAQALRDGEIAAVFLEVPVAKLFVARYCKSFTTAGPTYKVGGLAFAFPKGSPMLPDLNEALLTVSENGRLQELENSLTASEKCVDVGSESETVSLSPNSFWVLFIFTGGTSTTALLIYVVCGKWKHDNSTLALESIWMLILLVMKSWEHRKKRNSTRVSDAENPTNAPNTVELSTQG